MSEYNIGFEYTTDCGGACYTLREIDMCKDARSILSVTIEQQIYNGEKSEPHNSKLKRTVKRQYSDIPNVKSQCNGVAGRKHMTKQLIILR